MFQRHGLSFYSMLENIPRQICLSSTISLKLQVVVEAVVVEAVVVDILVRQHNRQRYHHQNGCS
jgi:hypothetical protein